MKLSDAINPVFGKRLLLIENPGTGNVSVSHALRLRSIPAIPRNAKPSEWRKVFSETVAEWSDVAKMVLVRDPLARFNSLATALFYHGSSADELSGELSELLDKFAFTSKAERGKALLEFMLAGGEVPSFLRPQSEWLTCRMDAVIATTDIASWFNHEGRVSCIRLHAFRSYPLMKPYVVDGDLEMVREFYASDYELFARLRVWSPSPKEVRLVSGPCKSCQKYMDGNAARSDLVFDGTSLYEKEDSEESAAEKPVLHSRAKRKRRPASKRSPRA